MKKIVLAISILLLSLLYLNHTYGESPSVPSFYAETEIQSMGHPPLILAAQSNVNESHDMIVSDSSIIYESLKTILYFLVFVLGIFIFVVLKLTRNKKGKKDDTRP